MERGKRICTSSMVPTIDIDNRLIINKIAIKYKEPNIGDIIIFFKEKKVLLDGYWIKVVIARSNEVIDIKNDQVYIQGESLE